MSKLPENKRFFDFSDYARPFAKELVKLIYPTPIGAYTLTFTFLLTGIIAGTTIIYDYNPLYTAFLIFTKSMLDAADGEIARQRNEPSIVGRYLDSVFDFFVNLILFVAIMIRFDQPFWLMLIALICYQLQGSVYNYYYLVKRYQVGGDKTSRIIEFTLPKPFERDNVSVMKLLHKVYLIIYGWQDFLIHKLDPNAIEGKELPGWFLTFVSFLGLGFQLLVISLLVLFQLHNSTFQIFVFPFSIIGVIVISLRRFFISR